ncbi:MAG: nucleotidyltransferase family protein [Methylocystaceae bacterium]
MAAGYSSRTGSNKLLLDLGGKSVLERCLESMTPWCSRIIIVGGYRINELNSVLPSSDCWEIIFNSSYSDGMFSSVIKGISRVRGDRFFLCPGDYPLVQMQTYAELLTVEEPIVVPTYQGRAGHPVLITSRLIPDIVTGGYSSLRDFIYTNNPFYLDTMDAGIRMDIDTIEDYDDIVSKFYSGLHEGENIYGKCLGRNNSSAP